VEKQSKIFVAGAHTLIGAAIVRELSKQGYKNVVGVSQDAPDLICATQVDTFFEQEKPEYVFLAAGKSGGIRANQKYPADLIRDNLLTECHVIHSAYAHGCQKLLYVASSCSYPKLCPQPMRVESLLTGSLEPTNEAYAVAKIAGIKMCQAYRQQHNANFIVGIPANDFGVGDDFDPEDAHVIPALIHKMHQAKLEQAPSVEIWGTGSPRREFLFAGDLATACLFVMQNYESDEPINLGGGTDISIKELALLIKDVVGYLGELHFAVDKPDGMPLKALDSDALKALGWQPNTEFQDALKMTYNWFLDVENRKREPINA
jgi:GDP-L-fucose synthase